MSKQRKAPRRSQPKPTKGAARPARKEDEDERPRRRASQTIVAVIVAVVTALSLIISIVYPFLTR